MGGLVDDRVFSVLSSRGSASESFENKEHGDITVMARAFDGFDNLEARYVMFMRILRPPIGNQKKKG
ncbi:uncharacterized protein PgNI_03845 [Pyricularia grisea]|uniref:Uncharacterized protein n=1 Tax=Pyricularia grisea TaxID=148305 RepID=A0A6P8B9X8_PYRGI|nr:uncharacterized protein PgNI_03845 [Pyricularia grisea]TLD12616.1 hypothetical protein PgNI_03845 [Pyricularia grisea]